MDNNNSNNMFSSDWNLQSSNQYSFNYSSEPLQEPVPFEDFQFSLDFNIPLPLEIPPVPIPETDLFAEPVFMSSSSTNNNSNNNLEQQHLEQPSPMNVENHGGAVLDENERKAFSQFLDSFCGDQNMQFDPHQFAFFDHPPPMSLEPFHEEHRKNFILQSLDDQKRYFNNNHEDPQQSFKQQQPERPNAVYLQQSSAISPPYIKPIRENSTLTATPTNTSSSSTSSTTTKEINNGSNNGVGGGGAVRRGKPHKELLTEEEKRSNHIASEQKRRSMIRSGFKDLTEIVPTLKNINNSKSTVLFKAVDYIRYLEKRNKNLREKIKNLEIRVEVEGRMGALSRPSTTSTGTNYYKGSSDALLQHKTQQKQLMELQEKLQLHQRLLAQQQHHHHQQKQSGGHHHYMFEQQQQQQQQQQQHHHHQQQQQRWHTEPSSKDTKMEVDTTTSAEPLKATVSA